MYNLFFIVDVLLGDGIFFVLFWIGRICVALLKAAQFTGVFDKFFRRERNLYMFYLMLGWGMDTKMHK